MEASESLPGLPEPAAPGELVVQTGRLSGVRRPLTVPVTLIGQASGCDVRLNVDGVSALHCAILDDPKGLILRDLDSTLGTLVNGQRVVSKRLVNGDVIEVGPFQFAVALADRPTTEALPADVSGLEREREALRVQAAAVAAQQAALLEEEGRLQQRATALERQETQLASHLEDRERGLHEAEEKLRQERVAFEEECAAHREAMEQAQRDTDQARTEAQQDRQKVGGERRRLLDLRRRLRKRWRKQWDAQEARMKQREAAVAAAQERLQRERAKVTAFQERINSELELGRGRLREEWQQLGLAQQEWEATLNRAQAEEKRQQEALRARAAQVAAEAQALANERQRFAQHHAGLVKEAEGLEARISNQRSRLETLQREAARHEQILSASPAVGEPLALSAPIQPTHAAEPLPHQVRELAGTLGDQRLHLVEQWEKLLQVHTNWQQERTTVLTDLEATAGKLAQREGNLRAGERILDAAHEGLQRRQEEAARLRVSLEGWQARLTAQETAWQTQRDALLTEVGSREQILEVRRRQLEEVHQRRTRLRRQEGAAYQAALARCAEVRRQHSALWQECERMREALNQQERTLASRALALERYRLETINQAPDSARAESRLEWLCRRDGARLDAEARDLALERRKLLQERLGLDEQSARLNQLEEEMLVRQREWCAHVAEWEGQRAPLEEEDERRQQEVRRLRALHALQERQVRQLRDEIERIARLMIEEAEAPSPEQQAA